MIRKSHRSAERGFSLAEVLTATAIFAIIFVAALLIYDRSNKVYKEGVEGADMQQNTRVAFDKITADLRMTGFDFDRDGNPASALANPWRPNQSYAPGNLVQPDPPNGNTYQATNSGTSVATPFTTWDDVEGTMTDEPSGTLQWENMGSILYQQPDEQVEYAGKSTIVIRANLDYDYELGECDTSDLTIPCENGREQNLQSAFFPVVTTGNDEIVAYGLKPVTAPATPYTDLKFYADLNVPRDVHPGTGDEEQEVKIAGVDPCTSGCNKPPYTLVRFTWDADGTRVETPIADNIRSIEFKYFKDTAATAANEITTLPTGNGKYDGGDPSATVAERDTRAEIRAIRLNLIGMNPSPDPAYNDTSDTYAPKYRKYSLETLIVPRNIGRHGMREFTTTPPAAPELTTVCAGSCNAVYVAWIAAQTGGDVETYNILYDTDNCTSGFTYAEDAGHNVEGYAAQWITPGQTYYFAVQAINKYGSASSACISASVVNKTRPAVVASLKASGGDDATVPAQVSQIQLFWPPASDNESSKKTTTCNNGSRDEPTMPGAERRFYRIYRSKLIDVQPGDATTTVIMDEFKIPQPSLGGADMTFVDTAVANCQDYYYRIRVVDYCARQASFNDGNDATIGESTQYFPLIASNGIRGQATTVTQPAQPTGLAISKVTTGAKTDYTMIWGAVTKNEGDPTGPTIYVDKYRLEVRSKDLLGTWTSVLTQDVTGGVVTYEIKDLDTPDVLGPITQYEFVVYAVTCSDSPPSTKVYDPCLFGGTGNPIITIAPDTTYGGTGVSADPWVINDPANLVIESDMEMGTVTVQFSQGGSTVGAPVSFTSVPASTPQSIPIPSAASDDIVTTAVFSITDNTGSCTLGREHSVIDRAPGNCSLIDAIASPQPSPVVQAFTAASPGGSTAIGIHNTSALQLKVVKVIITWNADNNQRRPEQLTTVSFPTGTVTANCPTPPASSSSSKTTTVVPSSTQFIAASSNIPITVNFREPGGNQSINTGNPITRLCVQYQLPAGDILTCPIIPNNTVTCTVPASACQ